MNQKIDIKKVSSQRDYQTFVEFPFTLYRANPFWVPPLVKDEIETLDPKLNPVYQNATASLFLAYIFTLSTSPLNVLSLDNLISA